MANTTCKQMHLEAGQRFQADPSKCYQRHIRELYAGQEARPVITSLSGASVQQISNEEAADIILKFEWLRTMGKGTCLSYGLFLADELLGAVCFNTTGSNLARDICRKKPEVPLKSLIARTLCLCRGACVPHAPKNAASFLVRHACRLAYKDHGYCVFFAYSDPGAGEVGTIYQAVGWYNIGVGRGRGKPGRTFGKQTRAGKYTHMNFLAPDGKEVTSHNAYGANGVAARLGWTKTSGITKRDYLRSKGYQDKVVADKLKWVWFEGREKAGLRDSCRWPFLPYPKRAEVKP